MSDLRSKLEALADKWEAEAKPPKGHDWHDGQTIGRTGAMRDCAADLRALLSESRDCPRCAELEAQIERTTAGAKLAAHIRQLGNKPESPERVRMEPQPEGIGMFVQNALEIGCWLWWTTNASGYYATHSNRTAPSPSHRPVLVDGVWWWEQTPAPADAGRKEGE